MADVNMKICIVNIDTDSRVSTSVFSHYCNGHCSHVMVCTLRCVHMQTTYLALVQDVMYACGWFYAIFARSQLVDYYFTEPTSEGTSMHYQSAFPFLLT